VSKPGKIDGYYLSFSPAQIDRVNQVLKEDGYPQNGAGLKQFILEAIEPEEQSRSPGYNEKDLTATIQDYIRENPEQVQRVLRGGEILFNTFVRRKGRAGARP